MANTKEVSQQFKGTVILACMIAIIFFLLGALGMYFYLSEQNGNYSENNNDEVIPTPTPIIEDNEDLTAYNACGTDQVYTDITITDTTRSQCYKINLNDKKTYIEYAPAATTNSNDKWALFLGNQKIFSGYNSSASRITSIKTTEAGNVEVTVVGSDSTKGEVYTYNQNGVVLKIEAITVD